MKKIFIIFCSFLISTVSSLFCMECSKSLEDLDETMNSINFALQEIDLAMNDSCENIAVQLIIAQLYYDAKNFVEAKKWLKIPIEKKMGHAWFLRAKIYKNEGDLESAIKAHERAASLGKIKSENYLGVIWHRRSQINRALYHFKIAADKDDIIAQWNVGLIYEELNNLEYAKSYYRKAANKGDARSAANLGWILYEESKQKREDAEILNDEKKRIESEVLLYKGKEFLRMASKKKNANAALKLGIIFENEGKIRLARKYYLRADRFGCEDAKESLANLKNE